MAGGYTIVLALEGQLRLDDQPAFHEAVALAQRQGGGQLVVLASRPVDQRLRGPHQRRLEAQALASLRARLAVEAIPLLHFPQQSREEALTAMRPLLRPAAVLCCRESRLFSDWPLAAANFPRVFSDFRRRLERSPDPPLPPPDLSGLGGAGQHWPAAWLQPAPAGSSGASGPSLGPAPGAHPCDPRSAFPFSGDEPSALARLQHYFFNFDGLRNYKASRNGLVGAQFSSKFSPFLGIGSLSVRRIWQELLRYQALQGHTTDEGSEWMKQELLWREFFIWSEQCHGAAFHAPGGIQGRPAQATPPQGNADRQRFRRWTLADCGHPLIDAQLRELLATGYLSNRGRQWVASHFVNELRLPWTWGARFFEWMLIDAHPALNSGNWAYLAGVGSDPRSFGGSPRRFDLERQLRQYDPQETHRKLWT
jgi:deoxyribodipyrimidine photo-lyase